MPTKLKGREASPTLRECVEAAAESVRSRLIDRNVKGDLDIVTFLDLIEERVDRCRVIQQLAASSLVQADFKLLNSLMLEVDFYV